MYKLRLLLFFLSVITLCYTQNNDEVLANSYFKNGDYKKALVIYKSLHEKKPYTLKYVYKTVETYQQLEQYNEAEQLLYKRLDVSRLPTLLIELGYNYQLKDSLESAQALYKEAISYLDTKPNYVFALGKKFEDHALLDQAVMVYQKGKEVAPEKNYSIQLAKIYGDKGDIEKMFSNYIDYIAFRPNYINNIKRTFSQFISEDPSNENNKFLRRALLKKIQEEPNTYWYELLSWLYVQEKAYKKSFIQEKALYKRNPESLDRIIELALTAGNDNDNITAREIFNYVLETTQDPEIKVTAHQYILDIDTKNADTKTLLDIDKRYNNLLEDYGKLDITIPLQIAYAEFIAFNLKDTERANRFLKKSLKLNIPKFQKSKIKLLLADILVLQEKFNEALILYSQIKTSQKNSGIAQEAAYKIAKTSYYKGDFDWAESQLKVLKSATSQLIANDALDLKLLISDNKWEDSTQTALKLYAKADLLAFQNKTNEAIKVLNKVLTQHKGESIIDETLFKQALLYNKLQNFEAAEKNYQRIITDYSEDIFIDDAYYYLAELYNNTLDNPKEAKTLYEKIIFNHEDSIYFVEARKKYRRLRGDTIN